MLFGIVVILLFVSMKFDDQKQVLVVPVTVPPIVVTATPVPITVTLVEEWVLQGGTHYIEAEYNPLARFGLDASLDRRYGNASGVTEVLIQRPFVWEVRIHDEEGKGLKIFGQGVALWQGECKPCILHIKAGDDEFDLRINITTFDQKHNWFAVVYKTP